MFRPHAAYLILPMFMAISGTCVGAPLAAPAVQQPFQLAQATTTTETVITAPSAPPPLETETIPPPPSNVVFWQPGRWSWNGAMWAWVPGQYVQRPQPQAAWVPGQWIQQANGDGWQWIDGHWQ